MSIPLLKLISPLKHSIFCWMPQDLSARIHPSVEASVRGLLLCLMLAIFQPAFSQSTIARYPTKPIRMVIALAPGGGVDTSGRILAQKFTEAWGQSVVAENRPGAGGTLASEAVVHAPADGYTILMSSIGFAIAPAIYKLNFDAINDFIPISLFVQSASVLSVHPSLPVSTVPAFMTFVRARPDQVFFSTSGSGSGQHLTMEMLNRIAGLKLVHVPYKGTAPSMIDLVSGRVSVSAASATSTMPHVKAKRLRALANTGAKRSASLPELPTLIESGVAGVALDQWYGLFAPTGTAHSIIVKLASEVSRTAANPEVREHLMGMGLDTVGSSPEEFALYVKSETLRWGKLVKAAGIKAN